ncbi:S41 family peptidase [Tenuifilum thalassicum]|uniref:Tail specific protease domain-containing protein n=1 Tax=Tenuifilum thalassicum TaxID=2590900 RepID=A0A7D4CH81_9BACT|nr:S41 family peptidase [Tenuifilum thalassicum]QKG80346.1 hypothetical protein FHG85_08750 [Tenuifilum thalassicum]
MSFKKAILALCLIVPAKSFSQRCNCYNDFIWLKNTFEKNDAGFEWTINKKGVETYNNFSDSITSIAKVTSEMTSCENLLNDWTKFFRKGHIGIYSNSTASNTHKPTLVSKTMECNTNELNKIEKGIQGIWQIDSTYALGITLLNDSSNRKYVGSIVESKTPEWKQGEIKIEFFENNNKLKANYYMRDHSFNTFDVEQLSDNELKVGYIYLVRKSKMNSIDPLESEILFTDQCKVVELSNKTMLIRIPSFEYSQKHQIDKAISKNLKAITSHENLIIDLRDNGGGADNSFSSLVPLIYTNPIQYHSVEFLATPLNIESFKGMNSSFLARILIRKYIKKLERNPGQYVNLFDDEIITVKQKKIYKNPSKIYVLVNEGCASSTEQFILEAKQSSKVKIVGTNTFGALDVSNVTTINSPDSLFTLIYSMSRTLAPQNERIDGIGIKPDIIIPRTVMRLEWIKFAKGKIEAEQN